jgi:hypothetical protein
MSRQAGSIVSGISKPRRISAKRAGSRWRLCTAGPAKGQGTAEPRADDPLESPEIGSVKIKDLAASSRPNQRYIQVSALSLAALVIADGFPLR